jgi:hypothetical protein
MSLFLRPTRIRSASPAYHMLSSLPLIPFKPPKTCWAESLQGARVSNEDECNTFPVKNKVGFFCVHDGHAGIAAVNMLQELMTIKWTKFSREFEWTITTSTMADDENVLWLANTYKNAERRLNAQTSGVVSVSALVVENQAIYFAWIGDCEGCVFVNDHELVDPIYKNADNVIEVMDFADDNVVYAAAVPSAPSLCATYPHSLLGYVRFRLKSGDDNSNNDDDDDDDVSKKPRNNIFPKPILKFASAEAFKYYFNVEPIFFADELSQKEYNKVKRRFPEVAGIDVGIQRIGTAEIFLDVRISKSTQPTRSLGDSSGNLPILRVRTVH